MVSDILRVRVSELAARFNGEVEENLGELELTVDGRYILEALTDAKNFADVPCDFLHDLCGMDLGDHLEVVYQLSSLRGPQRLRIIARVERDNPVINSVTQIWKGSDFLEREAFDMFGLQFRGHPNLKRIYMWDDFEGYPMRKDYVIESHEQRAVMRVRKEGE
ncbi:MULTISPECIES: NADH-quinone oxidoreductase subunit C [Desulfosporosinus]|uniref:NADH-quinone oxidoreductase n=1 Tax=Desulfosporosinus nitroreducens TaxID=2018668 RepID=A0ABT8QV09_9FIRM|nr:MULTISPECIES: NADH-quinone oxidoreductase subunit C [Desulfosporosinus]MDA8221860.1 NADH-quinone oxidoreductase subunit C [Desulfitobacterium hafniense]MDO0825192.1 NADH-quinone oxidoreductase subunit C [Desulfosporosinus nitroreducens]